MEIQGMNADEQKIINKLIDIMKEQNMNEQAGNMESITRYIVGMQVQLAMVTNELRGIKEQLGMIQGTQPAQQQNAQKGSVKAADKVAESVQQFEEKTDKLAADVSGAKTHLVQTAAKAVHTFVEKGKHAMNRVLQSGISKIRNRLQDSKISLADTITAYANTAEKINSASNELSQLKQIRNSFADIGKIMSGKDNKNLDKASDSLNASLEKIQSKVAKKNKSMEKMDKVLAKLDKISDSLNASLGAAEKEGKTEQEAAAAGKTNIQETAGQAAEPPVEKQEQKENTESAKDMAKDTQKEAETEKTVTPIYLKLPPAGREEFRNLAAYLKANGAVFDADKKAWYVTENQDLSKFKAYLPAENGKSAQEVSQSAPKRAESQKAVTPIYLKLPPAGKEGFKKMTAYLKANGAAFDADKKAWYITENQDLNKFKAYMPAENGNFIHEASKHTQKKAGKNMQKTVRFPVNEGSSGENDRESIRNQLSQKKEIAEKQNGQGEPPRDKKQEACL